MNKFEYRTFSSDIAENSFVVINIKGTPTVRNFRVQNLALQIAGLIHLIVNASAYNTGPYQVGVRPEVMLAIERYRDGYAQPGTGKVLLGLFAVLKQHDHVIMVPSDPAPDLDEMVESVAAAENLKATPLWELSVQDKKWVEENNATVVYTDASVLFSPASGSWAWYVNEDQFDSGVINHLVSTSSAERFSIAQAVRALEGPLLIVTDHAGGLHGKDTMLEALNQPDPFEGLHGDLERVRLVKVRGHDACPGNLAVDRIANLTLDTHFCDLIGDQERMNVALAAEAYDRMRVQEFKYSRKDRSSIRWAQATDMARKHYESVSAASGSVEWKRLDKKSRWSLVKKRLNAVA